jgi:hypothetical protein
LSDPSVMCTWLQKSRFTEMSDPQTANTPQKVVVNDLMQTDYRYELSEPMGENFDNRFKPELSPAQMLKMGVFGGRYMTDCLEEYPDDWFSSAKLSPRARKPALNFFNVDASKPLSYWEEKGWIHDDDPRGWFQWYCRYFMGRRHADDERQIKRWRNMTRHISQLKKNCMRGDLLCRPRQRQALLHWAYDSRRF